MIIADKKKAANMILSKIRPDGGASDMEVAPETGEQDEYTAAAEDILAAVKSGSVQDLASCLRALISED